MIVVVPVDPPHEGVLPSIVERTPLSPAEAAALYRAAAGDVLRTADASGGDLLVNYRDEGTLPDGAAGDRDPEAAVRALAADALSGTDDVRFERQVGSTRAARIGNTVSHLLNREGATSVGVLAPTAPLVDRPAVDGAAMALRRHDVVLGPAESGRTFLAGFAEPIDFEDAYATPELATLARRGTEAGLEVGFVSPSPTVDEPSGLASTMATIEARAAAGRAVPESTARTLADLSLAVRERDGQATIVRLE